MATHSLTIPRWHPAPKNQLLKVHWRIAHRRKKSDREIVAGEALAQGIAKAKGRRRVHLCIVLGPRQRGCDVDAYHASLLDAMKHAGLIVDDSPRWCEITPVTFARGVPHSTIVTFEDLEP